MMNRTGHGSHHRAVSNKRWQADSRRYRNSTLGSSLQHDRATEEKFVHHRPRRRGRLTSFAAAHRWSFSSYAAQRQFALPRVA